MYPGANRKVCRDGKDDWSEAESVLDHAPSERLATYDVANAFGCHPIEWRT
jgi:hypothetical protein